MAKLPIPSVTRAECALSSCPSSRVRGLVDWDLISARHPFAIYRTEVSTTSEDSVGAVLTTLDLRFPDYAPGLRLNIVAESRIVGGSQGRWWVRDVTDGLEGSQVVESGAVYSRSGPTVLDVPLGWEQQRRTLEIRGYLVAPGELFWQSINRLTAWFEDDLG